MTWVGTFALALGGLLTITIALWGGCYYENCDVCDCRDGGGAGDGAPIPAECQAPADEVNIDAYIEGTSNSGRTFTGAPGNYVTVDSGGTLNLTATLSDLWERPDLPDSCIDPISYTWVHPGGTETGDTIGPLTFTSTGTVTMTAAIAAGQADLEPAVLNVTVWDGVFTDDFNRTGIDYDVSGWSYRVADVLNLEPSPAWTIQNNMLHADWGSEGLDMYCSPGRQAMLARPEAQDARVTVRQNRGDPGELTPHYSDIILRYQFRGPTPSGPDSPFYRLRLHEAATFETSTDCVFIDVFRIDVAGQEFGTSLEQEDAHRLCDWPLGDAEFFEIDVSITGTNPVRIQASVASSSQPGTFTLSHTFEDSAATRVQEQGRFGVSQCWGSTSFDNFRLERLGS
jgi:hypothetical protein